VRPGETDARTAMTHISLRRPRGWRRFVLALLLAVPLGACQAPPPMEVATPAPGPAQEYQLGAGDKVRVHVFGDETLSGNIRSMAGAPSLSVVGAVNADGLTSTQLESAPGNKLKEYMRAPNVSVEILNYRRSNRRRDQEAGELSVM